MKIFLPISLWLSVLYCGPLQEYFQKGLDEFPRFKEKGYEYIEEKEEEILLIRSQLRDMIRVEIIQNCFELS